MITKIKICGITRFEDAEAAAREGADALGFIFVRSSPRYVEPEKAKDIIRSLPPFVTPVGVLTTSTRSEALALIAKSGVRCLQLHGEIDSKQLDGLPVPWYRVFHVSPEFRTDVLRAVRRSTFMLDTHVDGRLGGTGKSFDWNIAVQAKEYGRVILSGGINPENVSDAVHRVLPYAIDVSSGVEVSPGAKDHRKIHDLIASIAKAERGNTSQVE